MVLFVVIAAAWIFSGCALASLIYAYEDQLPQELQDKLAGYDKGLVYVRCALGGPLLWIASIVNAVREMNSASK